MKIRLPKTRRYRVYLYILSTLLIVAAVDMVWMRLWRHVPLGRDTTRITAPLKPDGTPDYFEYVRAKGREGVTRENNAAIPMIDAFGPDFVGENRVGPICDALGIPVPPARPAIESYDDFYHGVHKDKLTATTAENDKLVGEEASVRRLPWSAAEHADVFNWLADNKVVLSRLEEIVSRPRCYFPPVVRDPLLISWVVPSMGKVRSLCNLVVTRAMLEVNEGRFAEARADLLACHRLARLIAQGPTLIEYMVAIGIDSSALEGDCAFAAAGNMSPAERRALADGLGALTPMPPIEQNVDNVRFSCLDGIMYIAKDPGGRFAMFSADETSPAANIVWRVVPAHFSAAMETVNTFFDQYMDDFRQPTYNLREAAMNKTEADIELFISHRNAFIDPARQLVGMLVPALGHIDQINSAHMMLEKMPAVSIALALYHRDHRAYPETLAGLAPEYTPALPEDLFTNAPLQYVHTADAYLVYSVGPNKSDEHGLPRGAIMPRGYTGPHPDDIAIRAGTVEVPPAAKPISK